MQLAVRWCGVAALLASSAALAISIAGHPAPSSSWGRFDSDPSGADQPAFIDCLSTHADRVALAYFPDGSIRSVSAHRESMMARCLERVASKVPVTQPAELGVFVPCARQPLGEPESFGKVFVDSREELARCVLGGPQRVHVVVPRTELGALVFDPADIPSARCVGATACGHRYVFGPESGARGIMMSVP